MDIIRTVNADRRYYLDEDKIYNADSLVDTIRRFNDIKIQMYNHLYDLRYDNTGVFSDMTYSNGARIPSGSMLIMPVPFTPLLPGHSHPRAS